MRPRISNANEIKLFFHCGICVSEYKSPDIEAGYTEVGFQVWCRNHDCNIFHMDLEGYEASCEYEQTDDD